MSLLIAGVSHQSAPLPVLEALALEADRCHLLMKALHASTHIEEVLVLSTCNRTEVFVEAITFHGALSDISEALAATSGVPRDTLRDHLYVHFEDTAVSHAFTLAAGLDSMAVGEAQILGQLRQALAQAQVGGYVGSALNALAQQGLRVGKRVHTETGIDEVSRSFVDAGLAAAADLFGPLADTRVLVLGAGGMGALAATTAARHGAEVTVVNRTEDRARRLAERLGARSRPIHEVEKALAEADVVLASTGALAPVVTLPNAADAQVARAGRPQLYVDLAHPHDVAVEVGSLTGVRRLGLADLGRLLATGATSPVIEQARAIVDGEVTDFLTARAGDVVGPTVAALREQAASVVTAELTRLERRTDLNEAERAEVDRTVHRIVEKILHTPTRRVRELAGEGSGVSYERALSDLFDLPIAARSTPGSGLTVTAAVVPDPLPEGECP